MKGLGLRCLRSTLFLNINSRPLAKGNLFTSSRSSMTTKMTISRDRISNLQAYTSGHWLRNDSKEREARRVDFDFDKMAEKVASLCPGSKLIVDVQKLEGGYNKILICTLDTGQRLVIKYPTFVAGPPRFTTDSEVATVAYLQSKTQIPIPKILDWSGDPTNPLGSEYIIMEHADGVPLDQMWPNMSEAQQIRCIRSIVEEFSQVTKLNFPSYGSIYFDTQDLQGYSTSMIEPGFCVGPNCAPRYWNCHVASPRNYGAKGPNIGPWWNLITYCHGLLDAARSRIPPSNTNVDRLPRYQGTPAEHLQIIRQAGDVIEKVIEDIRVKENSLPMLFHPDLHKRNIFVAKHDPTRVTAIIDWQSATVEPAFYYADEIPDFATPVSEEPKHDTEVIVNEDTFTSTANLCKQVFDLSVHVLAPRLASARALNEDLIRPIRYCHRTWKDGVVVLRQELLELSRRWEDLGLSEPCPYPLPSAEDLQKQEKEFKIFQSVLNSKRAMVEVMKTTNDGWTPNETWEEVQSMHQTLYSMALEEVQAEGDPDFSIDDFRSTWPFDLPCQQPK